MPLRKLRAREGSMQSDAGSIISSSSSLPGVTQQPVPLESKADQAAVLALQLGSERSWADQFVPDMSSTSPVHASLSLATGVENRAELPSPTASPALSRTQTAATPPTPLSTTSELSQRQSITRRELPPTYDDVINNRPDRVTRVDSTVSANEPTFTSTTPIEPIRSYTLNESYKSISGVFTFYDYLELSSSAGSINVILDPQPGDKPAVLRINAQYGSVKLSLSDTFLHHMEKTNTMLRPWDVVIVATTGSINTKLPIGRGSSHYIEAQTGSIKSTFYAASVGPNDEVSKLTTVSNSGSQKVKIESYAGKLPISNIAAKHHAKSHGSLKIEYPKTWQGKLHALSAGHGVVKVYGDEMQHTHYGDKERHSWRGDGQQIEVLCDGHGGAKISLSN